MPWKIHPEEFVKVWQASASLEEVSKKTGLTLSALYDRSKRYREHGVPLKELPRRPPVERQSNVDWDKLAKLAEELAEED